MMNLTFTNGKWFEITIYIYIQLIKKTGCLGFQAYELPYIYHEFFLQFHGVVNIPVPLELEILSWENGNDFRTRLAVARRDFF